MAENGNGNGALTLKSSAILRVIEIAVILGGFAMGYQSLKDSEAQNKADIQAVQQSIQQLDDKAEGHWQSEGKALGQVKMHLCQMNKQFCGDQ